MAGWKVRFGLIWRDQLEPSKQGESKAIGETRAGVESGKRNKKEVAKGWRSRQAGASETPAKFGGQLRLATNS